MGMRSNNIDSSSYKSPHLTRHVRRDSLENSDVSSPLMAMTTGATTPNAVQKMENEIDTKSRNFANLKSFWADKEKEAREKLKGVYVPRSNHELKVDLSKFRELLIRPLSSQSAVDSRTPKSVSPRPSSPYIGSPQPPKLSGLDTSPRSNNNCHNNTNNSNNNNSLLLSPEFQKALNELARDLSRDRMVQEVPRTDFDFSRRETTGQSSASSERRPSGVLGGGGGDDSGILVPDFNSTESDDDLQRQFPAPTAYSTGSRDSFDSDARSVAYNGRQSFELSISTEHCGLNGSRSSGEMLLLSPPTQQQSSTSDHSTSAATPLLKEAGHSNESSAGQVKVVSVDSGTRPGSALGRAEDASGDQISELPEHGALINRKRRNQTVEIVKIFARSLDEADLNDERLAKIFESYASKVPPEIEQKTGSCKDTFILEKIIGKGRYGKVWLCKKRHDDSATVDGATPTLYAAKILSAVGRKKEVENEIEILKTLSGHRHLIQIHSVFTSRTEVTIVTEYIQGGELFKLISENEMLTESIVNSYTRQILTGLEYIHSKGIIHRDLKPENILCIHFEDRDSPSKYVLLKIIDFGFATFLNSVKSSRLLGGTTLYMAPETINYDAQDYYTDMWAAGVIIYNMLSGITPFEKPPKGMDCDTVLSDQEIFCRIQRGEFDFDDDGFTNTSDEAKDLITKLLSLRPKDRPTASQCLQHRWFHPATKTNPARQVNRSTSLRRFQYLACRIKQDALGMSTEQVI